LSVDRIVPSNMPSTFQMKVPDKEVRVRHLDSEIIDGDDDDDLEAAEDQPLLLISHQSTHPNLQSYAFSPRNDDSIDRCGSPAPGAFLGDIVQFSAPVYFADEDEDCIEVEVIRLGTLNGVCSANFSTHDGTAKHRRGHDDGQYEKTLGTVTFEDGEHTKTLTVKILEDGKWTPSTEFRMTLVEPQGCKLGMFQHAVRVKLINGDAFPSNDYMKLKSEGEVAMQTVHDWILFFDYCRFNYETAGVKWSTLVCLLFDQLSNLFLFVTLFVGVYMVDTILARGTSTSNKLLIQGSANDRYHTAVLIALWYILPTTLLYAWDAYKVRVDIRGTSRKFLLSCMMRTYLQYTQASQTRVTPTDLNVVMAQSGDAVAKSYVAGINIVRCVGKVIVVMLFIMAFQRDMFAICLVASMPLLLLVFTLLRVGAFREVQKVVDDKLRVMLMVTHDSCMKYRLAAEYLKRNLLGSIFNKSAQEHTESLIPVNLSELRTVYVTKFLSGCFIAFYIVVKAHDVLDNKLSLGVFLATIAIFGTYLADAITELNEQLNIIIESFTSLQEFTLYFNLPLEAPALKKINIERRRATTAMRAEMHRKGAECQEATDAIPLKTQHLSIRNLRGETVLKDVNVEVEQGRLVAVIGSHASGKKVFLELMSDLILPSEGSVFLPSHLRVLHVSREPMFLRMTLTHNLTLGLPNEAAVDINRVKTILSLLHLDHLNEVIDDEMRLTPMRDITDSCGLVLRKTDDLIDVGEASEMADSNPNVMSWLELLSHSTRVKLHIARALVANPNVMILQRPLHHFNEEVGDQVLDVLRLHVQNRGLGYRDANVQHRRPRTVFFIPDTASQARKADTIWECDRLKRTVIESHHDTSQFGTKNVASKRASEKTPADLGPVDV